MGKEFIIGIWALLIFLGYNGIYWYNTGILTSTVARRVILHGQHVLQIDGMQYELIITPHCERMEPDVVCII